MLERICRASRAELPDYDAARQVYWAFRTIYRELEPEAGADSPVVKLLDDVDKKHGFSLPSAGMQVPIEQTLVQRLKAVEAFDPASFQARLGEICRHLPRR